MKLVHVTVTVKDLERSLRFYRDVIGLPLQRRFSSAGAEIAFLGDGDTEIELLHSPQRNDISHSQDISLGFEVASLQQTIAELKLKNIFAGEVHQPNDHVRFAFANDPDGLRIQFVENIR